MELGNYIKPLLRWWWLLLVSTLLAVVSSYLVMSRQPPTYQATATLMIGPAFDDPNPSGSELNLSRELARTYADIAYRRPVREQTMSALGLNWLPEYQARPLPNSQLLEIVVVDSEPERAQAVANELANQLILQSPTASRSEDEEREVFIQSQLASLQTNIEQTEEEISARQGELEEAFSARRISELENEIAGLQNKLSDLRATYSGLLGNTRGGAVNTVRLFEPATLPSRATNPGKLRLIAVAGAVALSLAAGTAYLLEYLDDTIRSPDQVTGQFGLPVVGTIARLQEGDNGSGLTMRDAPRSREAEGFRSLRLAVQFALSSDNLKTLLITSPHRAEGKSLVAANLAMAMAQAGLRTLLIDSDLHLPSQHKTFGFKNRQGLSSLLLHPESLENGRPGALQDALANADIIKDSRQDRLSVMTSGSLSSAPSELLATDIVRKLLNLLAPGYDVIILDSPPALAVSDAVALSSQVDSVFVLASAQQTRRSDLQNVLEQLKSVEANVKGVILNRLSPNSEHYYYRYAGYGYKPGNVQDESGRPADPGNGLRRRLLGWFTRKGSVASQSQTSDS